MIETERDAFYRCSLWVLRLIEAREGAARRFGDDADVIWRSYATRSMGARERLELLIADASRQWRGALSARRVFGLPGDDDDAFGPVWQPGPPAPVQAIWREVLATDDGLGPSSVFRRCAEVWERPLSPVELPELGAGEVLAVSGASAIGAAITRCAERSDYVWHRQVAVVAHEAAERQLGLLGAVLVGAEGATQLVEAPPEGARRLCSEDARPADKQAMGG